MLKNKFFLSFAFCFIVLNFSFSQKIKFSTSEPSFQPPIASFNESRTGLIKDLATTKIRLDIGISPDIFDMEFDKDLQPAQNPDESLNSDNNSIEAGKNIKKLSLGADFHAFGLLFNESAKIILQVDAIDAFFGGHFSYKTVLLNNEFSIRFRIMHLSSHLVDGHYSTDKGMWKNNKLPMPFGREFFDLSACYKVEDFRFYLGADYIFRQRPNVLSKTNYESSIEYLSGKFPSDFFNLFLSYNFKLNGIDDRYSGSNTIMSGIRMGRHKGLDLFVVYYSGKNYYGEYYNENLEYLGAGFNIFIF
jgi:hypothetical protein